ncbi:hypothetical protein NQZ68_020885 [Dissostichus eleginoides]|nr:hypothetical protein NQZ68_020885 [Dissostichus eleginoides]
MSKCGLEWDVSKCSSPVSTAWHLQPAADLRQVSEHRHGHLLQQRRAEQKTGQLTEEPGVTPLNRGLSTWILTAAHRADSF